MTVSIIWPTIALVALIFAVWNTLLVLRFRHARTFPPSINDFADRDAMRRYFHGIERPADNLANLFEMPVLYFVLVPLIILTGHATIIQVCLAWIFVGLRFIHSFTHILPNLIRPRMRTYLFSCVILSAMWIGFAIDLLRTS